MSGLLVLLFLRVALLFLLLAEHAFQDLGHVLHCLVDPAGDIDRALLLEGEHDGVAWTGVEFEDFAPQFVLHREDDTGEIGAFVDIVDGVVLLPLMLYHALQLMAGSTIAKAMGKIKDEGEKMMEKEKVV